MYQPEPSAQLVEWCGVQREVKRAAVSVGHSAGTRNEARKEMGRIREEEGG